MGECGKLSGRTSVKGSFRPDPLHGDLEWDVGDRHCADADRQGRRRQKRPSAQSGNGSRSWARTTIHAFKGRCPTIRRSGKGDRVVVLIPKHPYGDGRNHSLRIEKNTAVRTIPDADRYASFPGNVPVAVGLTLITMLIASCNVDQRLANLLAWLRARQADVRPYVARAPS